jgi:hypothetical protein
MGEQREAWTFGEGEILVEDRERLEGSMEYYPSNLFYYASFTNAQLPLLKVAALWFDKLVIRDPVGASWDTVGADHIARDAVRQLKDTGIPEIVTPATVLAKYEALIAGASPSAAWLTDGATARSAPTRMSCTICLRT